MVHGDDFTALGSPHGLNKFEEGMTQSFECKLKGRLGTGPNDCKEMRVLNRIVRISENGLLYEADPRHAEMLIRSFNLGEAKSVVTPGVKTAIDEDVDPDQVDAEAAIEINRIIAELKPQRSHCGKVRFCSEIKTYDIPAYSTIYGSHPREFVFDKRGRKISPGTGDAVDK